MPCPFRVDGSIIVGDGAILLMQGCAEGKAQGQDFEVIQEPGDDRNIILQGSAELRITDAMVLSHEALDIQSNGSSTLEIAGSTVNLDDGEVKGAFNTITVDGTQMIGGAWTASSVVKITRSSIAMKSMLLSLDSELDTVETGAEIMVTAGTSRLTDVHGATVKASGSGEARLFRWVDLWVTDGLSVALGGATVKEINLDDGNLSKDGPPTLGDGHARLQLIHDIIRWSSPKPVYVGNWRIEVGVPGLAAAKQLGVSLPEYGHPSYERSISYSLGFKEVRPPAPSSADVYVETDWTLAGGTEKSPLAPKGNIVVMPGATLTLGSELFLKFQETALGRSFIVRGGATLELAGAKVTGCLGIYLEAGATLSGSGLDSDCGLGSLGGKVTADKAWFRSGMSGDFESVVSSDLSVLGQTNISKASLVELRNASFGDDTYIDAAAIDVRKAYVNGAFILPQGRKGELKVYSLNYVSLDVDPELTLKRYWNLDVLVKNGGGRLVPNALVTVRPLNASGDTPKPERTGADGRVSFDLLGDTSVGGKASTPMWYEFAATFNASDGDYHTGADSVILDADRKGLLEFKTTIIPPEMVHVTVIVPPKEYQPGDKIEISGEVTLQSGAPAANAIVNATITDTGARVPSINTDPQGRYLITLTAPQTEGTYTVLIEVYEPGSGLRGSDRGTFSVRRTDAVAWTITIIVAVLVSSLVGLYSVSRYRKWQEFRRDARENPLFKEERMFDEVERQLRTELAREMRRPAVAAQPGTAGAAPDENGRGKRKRGGPLGTDGGEHLAVIAARMRLAERARNSGGAGKPSSSRAEIDAQARRP